MRTKIGTVLMFLSIPYTIWGILNGHDPSVYMGVVALIVSGGLMIARDRNRAYMKRRPDLVAVPKPSSLPTCEGSAQAANDAERPDMTDGSVQPTPECREDRQATILPPPPHERGKPRLRLVYTDGVRMTPEQLRRKAK